jgi:hypothetical protein
MGKISVKFLVGEPPSRPLRHPDRGAWDVELRPVQFRVSEALTVLPFLMPEAVPGLFVGCIIANLFSTNILSSTWSWARPPPDRAWCTWQIGRKVKSRRLGMLLAPLPPVALNAVMIGGMLTFLSPGVLGRPFFWTYAPDRPFGISGLLPAGLSLLHIIGRPPRGEIPALVRFGLLTRGPL